MWGPLYLASFSGRCLSNAFSYDDDLRRCLAEWCGRTPALRWGSGCSGTDCPKWVWEAISQGIFDTLGTSLSVSHVLSAEKDPRKRAFLKVVSCPAIMAADIYDLSSSSSIMDHMTNMYKFPCQEAGGLHCFVAGFVCKSVSGLNKDKESAARAVGNTGTATGATLHASLLIAERLKPKAIILENVLGLRRCSQHLEVCNLLGDVGFEVAIFELSPLQVGFPQERPRLYFLGVQKALLADAGWSRDRFCSYVTSLVACMQVGHPHLDLDDVLSSEQSEYILRRKAHERAALAKRCSRSLYRRRSETDVPRKWVEKHRASSATCTISHWDDSKAGDYPAYMMLPDRIRDLLDHWECKFPDTRKAVLNCSQSTLSVGIGHAPTLTPQGFFWLTHRGRPLYGREMLALQGLFLGEDEWSKVEDVATEELLQDLAGNAFNAVSALPIQLTLLLLLSKLDADCQLMTHDPASACRASSGSHKSRKRKHGEDTGASDVVESSQTASFVWRMRPLAK